MINKISLSSYIDKKYAIKDNVVGYHIFINLLFNHRKFNFVEYRQFVWVFTLVGTPVLFSFFQCNKKNYVAIFFFINIK